MLRKLKRLYYIHRLARRFRSTNSLSIVDWAKFLNFVQIDPLTTRFERRWWNLFAGEAEIYIDHPHKNVIPLHKENNI